MSSEPTHKHKCSECGTIWEHSNNCHGVDEAHMCSECGKGCWEQYWGDEPCEGPAMRCDFDPATYKHTIVPIVAL